MITVDAGNLLVKHALIGKNDPNETVALITAHGIESAYKEIGYDAVAVSANDLSLGLDFLQRSTREGFPWVSSNIFDDKGTLLFPPHIIKIFAGRTIGILGVTGGVPDTSENYFIGEWRKALTAEISLLKNDCDLLILLSTLNSSENQEILADYKQIDILVMADELEKISRPQVVQNTLVAGRSGDRGKYIGKIEIRGQSRWNWVQSSISTSKQLNNRIRSLDYQITRLEEQQNKTKQDFGEKLAELRVTRQGLIEKMANKGSENHNEVVQDERTFAFTLLPVKPTNFDKKINLIVQDIKKSTATFNRFRRTALNDKDPDLRLALDIDAIAGATECAQCHEKQTGFWKNTGHAKAYATLSGHGQNFNLQCLPCHVTAGKVSASSDESKRLYLLSLKADRQTIGCEVCHGAGKEHLESPESITPHRIPPEAICLQCHTAERDNDFEYLNKLKAISCPTS